MIGKSPSNDTSHLHASNSETLWLLHSKILSLLRSETLSLCAVRPCRYCAERSCCYCTVRPCRYWHVTAMTSLMRSMLARPLNKPSDSSMRVAQGVKLGKTPAIRRAACALYIRHWWKPRGSGNSTNAVNHGRGSAQID